MSLFAPHPEWQMPASFRPFSWIEPQALGACIYPQSDVELAELSGLGVTLLVNLHERAHPDASLARHRLRQLHIPVADMTPPLPEQLDEGVAALHTERAAGKIVVVHCAVGLGRTGTLIACYLVSKGQSAETAIAQVRAARPGSVETRLQEQAVAEYAARIRPTR